MSDSNWQRVKDIFHDAMKLPIAERGQFLDDACGDDMPLRSEVEALLASHDEIGDDTLVSRATIQDGEATVFPVEGPGTVIGNYRLLEKIGEGGMGVVYLAEQKEPVRRRVALKIIKLGMDTREVIARFEAERQALAIMDHSHIARVFDAGTTELGRPYFVMEHVQGLPITEYCDQHRLNARERLALYVPVCQAIHHAHQRAIIHRDVKPTNVLVMVQDGKPVPKVIDFGVAKATSQRLTEKTIFTGHGVLIGTPAYMSPEQAEMTGLNVDTTTDVYSLGATLYELLSGAPPFDPKSMREAGLDAIHRMIREVDPPKPSTRVGSLGGEATTVAQQRRTQPATLEREIRGELDWITMRAMEKDRSRRYPSASEFAADIERYLQGEPVLAGPPGAGYRLRTFVRRNRALVSATVAAVVVLAGFAVTMTIQSGRIASERDRALLEARRSRAEAELNQEFYREILRSYGTPEVIVSRARQAWDLNRQSLAGDPAGLALHAVNMLPLLDLMDFFGHGDKTELLQLRTELEAEAFDLIGQAVAARDTSILRTVGLMILRLEDRSGMSEHGSEMIVQLYRDALAVCRDALPGDDPRRVQNLTGLADYLEASGRRALQQGRAADAEPVLRELLEARLEVEALTRGWTWRPAIARGLLGESLVKLKRYAEAEPLLLEALKVNKSRDARVRVIEMYESWAPEKVDRYREDLWVDSIRELGTVGTPETRKMDGGSSAVFAGRSVWAFRDGLLANEGGERRGFRANRWAWTDDMDAHDGIRLQEPGHAFDGRRDLLPLTPDEKAFNDAHSEDPAHDSDLGTAVPTQQWALFPGPVIADPDRGRALVVYSKVHAPNVYGGGQETVGSSLAVWEHPDSAVVRPIVRPGTEHPTMLFQGDEPFLGKAAVVDTDFLYLYAQMLSGMDSYQIVARAPLEEVLDRNAWRFFAGDGRWTPDWTSAVRVLGGSSSLSVHWNAYLGKYMAVSTTLFHPNIAIQTADRPEGTWSSQRVIYSGWGANGKPVASRGAVAHPEFARGRVEYITFYRPTGFLIGELRLLEITLR